jgi:hypothetical protein
MQVSPERGIVNFLKARKFLLILDNVDDVRTLKSGGHLHWVFGGLGKSCCLVTSRTADENLLQSVEPGYMKSFAMTVEDNNAVLASVAARYASRGRRRELSDEFKASTFQAHACTRAHMYSSE